MHSWFVYRKQVISIDNGSISSGEKLTGPYPQQVSLLFQIINHLL
jgi:hypothetical protein